MSNQGGILDIIKTNFSDVKTAIQIKNFINTKPEYLPREMNAFNIIDCEFNVSSTQRSRPNKYKHCIEINGSQRVSIEGCHFNSVDQEEYQSDRGRAVEIVNSSVFFHKSGNFRRDEDIHPSSSENAYCLEYGDEQENTGSYGVHPWLNTTNRKCEFNNWFQAITALGNPSNNRHNLVIDDAMFNNDFLPIKIDGYASPTITNSGFHFQQSQAKFNAVDNISNELFNGSNNYQPYFNNYSRIDISIEDCLNVLIGGNSFQSDYTGVGSNIGFTCNIGISEPNSGQINTASKTYVFDLVYDNSFQSMITGQKSDVGVWLSHHNDQWKGFINCNNFNSLKNAIYFYGTTKIMNMYHHTDIETGQNAPCLNVFGLNACDIDYGINVTSTFNYFYKNGGSAPNDCGELMTGIQSASTEINVCPKITCEKFPMVHTSTNKPNQNNYNFELFPNPSYGQVTITGHFISDKIKITVTSIDGKLILENSFATNNDFIVLPQIPTTGTFIISIMDGGRLMHKLFVISQ
ncbi:MAG: T9SS type A sorting domain-containing protein [Bacteroidetes bacterium]|nr:T9SS type A sorting domain-containing protein [Bacteroidota bacterium]